jgi:hypothetical protein
LPAAIEHKEREGIAAALRAGGKRNEVARKFKRSFGAVSKIAAEIGITFDQSHAKKASEARRVYAAEERLLLSDEMFEKLREMVAKAEDAGNFRYLAVSYGILTEKRLLETGEATNRNENRNISNTLEDEFRKLDADLERSYVEEESGS